MLIDTLGSRGSGNTLSKTSDNMQAKEVVDTPADMVAKMEAAEVSDTCACAGHGTSSHTGCHNNKGKSQPHFLNIWRCRGRGKERHTGHCRCRDTEQAVVEPETFADALGAGRAEALLEKLADTLAVVESVALRNTLYDVEAEALLDMVADKVALVENEK